MNTKKEIIQAGICQHQSLVKDFQNQLNEVMNSELASKNKDHDFHQHTRRAELLAEVHLLQDQLESAVHELDEMKRLEFDPEEPHNAVEFGTVVKTNRETFFVAADLEKFQAGDGTPVLGIPVHSPIYRAMKRKSAGDSFEYAGNTYLIEEII
jgi:transcription elongation GreA/GreB family factor